MPQNTTGLKRGGSPGRPKGVPNKATKEVKELSRRLVLDPEYQQKLKQRLLKGTLTPAVEVLLWHYAFGKPKDTVDLNVVRKVVNIIPFRPDSKPDETKTDHAPEKLPLPEEPPVRHLAPITERATYGPPAWPGRKPRW
jgi:hypothetical protein